MNNNTLKSKTVFLYGILGIPIAFLGFPLYIYLPTFYVEHIGLSDRDTMKQSIYKALRTICIENGIKLLAEGVETPYELEKIKEIGVDYAQGYYYAKPSAEIIRVV